MASMSNSILTLVVDCDFTWQVWEKVQTYFTCHTKARVQQLKIELLNTSKGAQSIAKYLLQIKALVNALVSIGCAVSEQEHIEMILGGLSTDYHAFVTSITMRSDPYSVVEVEAHLMAQEAWIEKTSLHTSTPQMQAHVANHENVHTTTDHSGSAPSQPQQVFHGFCSGRGGRFGGRGSRGRGHSSGRSSLICQLCHK